MHTKGFSISTITLARDAKEENVLRQSLQYLAGLKLPVFVCDGGSGSGFLDFLSSFSHFTIVPPRGRGVWEQAKSSVMAAYEFGSAFIFYTEPDKQDFFRHSLPSFLSKASPDERSGIVLASRSQSAFRTFPAFQQSTETTINNCCEEIAGKSFDYTYGPFLLNRKLVPYLNLVTEDIGWGWRPYLFGIASRIGYDVSNITGDFVCPPDQRQDNKAERLYRMRQLTQNIQGMLLSTSVVIAEEEPI
jgi:hypothetical protein